MLQARRAQAVARWIRAGKIVCGDKFPSLSIALFNVPTISNSCPRKLLLLMVALGSMNAAWAQYTPPPPPLTPGPCVATKNNPCPVDPPAPAGASSAERFPFPGETPGSLPGAPGDASSAPPVSPDVPSPAVPGQEGSTRPDAPAQPAGKFPFPGEPGGDASPANGAAESPGAGSSSSSSSSSDERTRDGTDSGSNGGFAPKTPFVRRHLPKVEDLGHRESEDLEVSRYYASTGNYIAAYMRAKDAVRVVPDDSAAHFALAEAALSLKKKDEAAAEYKACLQLAPQGDYAGKARKALAALEPQQP